MALDSTPTAPAGGEQTVAPATDVKTEPVAAQTTEASKAADPAATQDGGKSSDESFRAEQLELAKKRAAMPSA
jgi:hypothetical protein